MIYPLLFQYYLSKENQKECKSLLSKMCEIFPQDQINFMHTIYEINLEKSTKYIDEMKQNLENDTKIKGFFLYLIAKQYQNKHDKTEAIFYYQNALDEVKGTPLEEIVRYELKIVARIKRGEDMAKRITIKEISELANTSKTTVSFYLSGQYHKMSKETKARIEQAIKETNYIPNAAARRLGSEQSNLVGVIIEMFLTFSLANLLKELTRK